MSDRERSKCLRQFVLSTVSKTGRKGISSNEIFHKLVDYPPLNGTSEDELIRAINYQIRKGCLRKCKRLYFETDRTKYEIAYLQAVNGRYTSTPKRGKINFITKKCNKRKRTKSALSLTVNNECKAEEGVKSNLRSHSEEKGELPCINNKHINQEVTNNGGKTPISSAPSKGFSTPAPPIPFPPEIDPHGKQHQYVNPLHPTASLPGVKVRGDNFEYRHKDQPEDPIENLSYPRNENNNIVTQEKIIIQTNDECSDSSISDTTNGNDSIDSCSSSDSDDFEMGCDDLSDITMESSDELSE